MPTVTSADGTAIAYDKHGTGPALIIVDGALTTRRSASKPELIALLSPRLTVFTYDRRGRGDSGDTPPYAVALGGRVSKLAMYEAPYDNDPRARAAWDRYLGEMTEALAAGRPGDAVALFMAFVGTPAEQIDGMRRSEFWPDLEAVGPTLAYDHAGVLGPDMSVPAERAARVAVPTLVMHGAAGAPFMAETARALQQAITGAELRTLAGQGHNVGPDALAPLLAEFVTR